MLRGVMHVEEHAEGERQKIVIDEIPYNVNKSRPDQQSPNSSMKSLNGISDIRDESDKDGMRIVLELKRGRDSRRHDQPAL